MWVIDTSNLLRSSLAVSSGKPKDDDDDDLGVVVDDDDKYLKGDRTRMARQRTKHLALTLFLVTFAWIGRALVLRRMVEHDREQRYARARAMLRERADRHDAKTHRDPGNQVWSVQLEKIFEKNRLNPKGPISYLLKDWMHQVNLEILDNVHSGIHWARPYMLPSTQGENVTDDQHQDLPQQDAWFYQLFERKNKQMKWHAEYTALLEQHDGALPGPPVNYTDPDKYRYPPLMEEPPTTPGAYPRLASLGDIMAAWDQDRDNKGIINETLLHFDFSNPDELAMAKKFRDAMLPFKLYNVPEITRAADLWTDEYVAQGMMERNMGVVQESTNHFFSFYGHPRWDENTMGLPPTNNNDMTYYQWAQHATYADATRLASDRPHFTWTAGIPPAERTWSRDMWSFISRDLPSFSASDPNFILFHPEQQKGIQCRFGERGVVAATHFDGGRNMVAVIQGARRYILSPPKACGKLGVFPNGSNSPLHRHSPLNFGHFKYLDDPAANEGMSAEERVWLERASAAPAVETVLKAGEILYIPSFWFHYIVSLQKSAQCNVRSGEDFEPHSEFGGERDVTLPMCQPDDDI